MLPQAWNGQQRARLSCQIKRVDHGCIRLPDKTRDNVITMTLLRKNDGSYQSKHVKVTNTDLSGTDKYTAQLLLRVLTVCAK